MKEDQGWIKTHRKILNSPVFKNPLLFKMWMWCLLKATHCDYKTMIGLQEIELASGQFVFGRKAASIELDMEESTVYRYLMRLQKDKYLSVKSYNKYSIVSIENWLVYQGRNDDAEQQMNNKRTTSEHKQEHKNNKNKNIYREFAKENDSLYEALLSWEEMRNKIKKPLTDRARESALRKLSELTKDEYTQIKIVDQSTLHNWQTFYGLKDEFNKPKQEAVRPWG